jgi:hypothetical protein
MKSFNFFNLLFFFICATTFFACTNNRRLKSDVPIDEVTVKNLIDSQNFVFIARSVSYIGGSRKDLSYGYEVVVSKDTIVSYLPFFGRGYIASISPADVDFDFTSTKFTYTTASANRGWNISIKPKDQTYLRELYFRIFDNASASLNVTSLDRSAISFEGYIERKSDKKKK